MSEKIKHTPGPWTLQTRSSYKYGVFVKAEDQIIAGVGGMEFTPNTNLANARLIAAAPDLLAALEEAHTLLCYCAEEEPMGPDQPWDLERVERAIQMARSALAGAAGQLPR